MLCYLLSTKNTYTYYHGNTRQWSMDFIFFWGLLEGSEVTNLNGDRQVIHKTGGSTYALTGNNSDKNHLKRRRDKQHHSITPFNKWQIHPSPSMFHLQSASINHQHLLYHMSFTLYASMKTLIHNQSYNFSHHASPLHPLLSSIPWPRTVPDNLTVLLPQKGNWKLSG